MHEVVCDRPEARPTPRRPEPEGSLSPSVIRRWLAGLALGLVGLGLLAEPGAAVEPAAPPAVDLSRGEGMIAMLPMNGTPPRPLAPGARTAGARLGPALLGGWIGGSLLGALALWNGLGWLAALAAYSLGGSLLVLPSPLLPLLEFRLHSAGAAPCLRPRPPAALTKGAAPLGTAPELVTLYWSLSVPRAGGDARR